MPDKCPAVFYGGSLIENIHLSRKSQGDGKAVVLECTGFYYYLRRRYHFGNAVCEAVDSSTYGGDCLLCVLNAPGRGYGDTGLHDKRPQILLSHTAGVQMGQNGGKD